MNIQNTKRTESGVAVQVGFVLILAILIVGAAQYQLQVVPQQEEQAEIDHAKKIGQQMAELRADIVSTSENGNLNTQTLDSSPEYSGGANGIFPVIHPPEPSSSFKSEKPDSRVKVKNVENEHRASNYWNGEGATCADPTPQCYNNRILSLSTDYRHYKDNPEIVYENGILYDYYPNDDKYVIRSNQNIINGRTINLITVTGEVNTQRPGEIVVETKPVSAPSQSITVTNSEPDSNPTFEIPTRLPLSKWQELLGDKQYVASLSMSQGNNPNDKFNVLEIQMKRGETYTLKMSRVHITTQSTVSETPTTSPAYLAWRESENIAIKEGSQQPIYAEVRDKYNNGVSGIKVEASAKFGNGECAGTFVSADSSDGCSSSTRQPGERVSSENGGVEFIYQPPNVENDRNITVELGVSDDSVLVGNAPAENEEGDATLVSYEGEKQNYKPDKQIELQSVSSESENRPLQFSQANRPGKAFNRDTSATGRLINTDTLRVTDLSTRGTRHLANNTVEVYVAVDNTGPNTISGVPVVPTVTTNKTFVDIESEGVTTQIEPGEEKRYKLTYLFRRPGEYQLKLGSARENITVTSETNAHITATVQDTAPIGGSRIPPTYFRDSVGSNSEYRESVQIPPVDYREGNIADFANLFSQSGFASIIGEDIRVGMEFRGISEGDRYRINSQYKFENENISSVKLNIVRPTGKEVDKNTTYYLTNINNQQNGLSYLLSQKETEYLNQANNMYILVENSRPQSAGVLRMYNLYLTSGSEVNSQIKSNVSVRNITASRQVVATGQEATLTIQYENDGNKYKRFTPDLRYRTPSGQQKSIAYKSITVNPQIQSKVTYAFSTQTPGTYKFKPVKGQKTTTITVREP